LYVVDIQIGSFFLPAFAGQGVLNEDFPVWLHRPGPANTCIPPPSRGRYLYILLPQNTFASIKKIAAKIVKWYIRMIYNVATILFSDGESPNSFVWEIVHWQLCNKLKSNNYQ
jgi:hypothetical protein